MRKSIEHKVEEMIRLTKENPGKWTYYGLSFQVDLTISTTFKYCKLLNLPIRTRTIYTEEMIEFIKDNAHLMIQAECARALNLKPYQVQDIASRLGINFVQRPQKERKKSEFFEHDPYYTFY